MCNIIKKFAPKKRYIKRYILEFIIFYIVSYSILSLFGSYYLSQTGERRYSLRLPEDESSVKPLFLSVTDVALWQPKFIRGRVFLTIKGKREYQANFLGYFYCPLVVIDQRYIHKTRYLFDETDNTQGNPKDSSIN